MVKTHGRHPATKRADPETGITLTNFDRLSKLNIAFHTDPAALKKTLYANTLHEAAIDINVEIIDTSGNYIILDTDLLTQAIWLCNYSDSGTDLSATCCDWRLDSTGYDAVVNSEVSSRPGMSAPSDSTASSLTVYVTSKSQDVGQVAIAVGITINGIKYITRKYDSSGFDSHVEISLNASKKYNKASFTVQQYPNTADNVQVRCYGNSQDYIVPLIQDEWNIAFISMNDQSQIHDWSPSWTYFPDDYGNTCPDGAIVGFYYDRKDHVSNFVPILPGHTSQTTHIWVIMNGGWHADGDAFTTSFKHAQYPLFVRYRVNYNDYYSGVDTERKTQGRCDIHDQWGNLTTITFTQGTNGESLELVDVT